jgi:hypothetical protein
MEWWKWVLIGYPMISIGVGVGALSARWLIVRFRK